MMNKIYCPYCGAQMNFKIIEIYTNTYTYICPTCKARSPETVGQDQETTIKLAQKRMPTYPHLFTPDEFIRGNLIPTVIWLEMRNAEPVAGVWQQDHYEMGDGSAIDDPASVVIYNSRSYNRDFRFWDAYPDKASRNDEPWKGEETA